MIKREKFLCQIEEAFEINPVVAILGPRQCGKTTIAKQYVKQSAAEAHFFDLEDPSDLTALENPKLVLEKLTGLVVIDEIQRKPELFPILRVLVDRTERKQRFMILGSASKELIRQSSESLAGRVTHLELTPFNAREVRDLDLLWIRGGFPLAYLSKNDETSFRWRQEYISTFLERDLPQLGIQIPAESLRRFWLMLTHYHGHIFNASEISKSLGISDTTARRYLDLLAGTFMVRLLPPWLVNIKKRQVKSPKIYFRDSGIFHTLLDQSSYQKISRHPKLGSSWEGFALEELVKNLDPSGKNSFFWGVHRDAELDLLVHKNGKAYGFEIKYTERPKLTRSMKLAQELLNLDQLDVVVPGTSEFPLDKKIRVIGLEKILR